jgi:hypothetical protein
VTAGEFEVVWPLHRSHYLSPALTDEGTIMPPDPESSEEIPAAFADATDHGRALAVRALLAGADCLQQRVSDLLGVSRRTIGRCRMADADLSASLPDPQAREAARPVVRRGTRHSPDAIQKLSLTAATHVVAAHVRGSRGREPATIKPPALPGNWLLCGPSTGQGAKQRLIRQEGSALQ